MTTANRITLFRFVLTPLYGLVFYFTFFIESGLSWALPLLWGIFVLSEVSDLADGFVARRFNQVTDLGKLMDPFADVIFRITYLFLFSILHVIPWWTVLIILWREFTILFIRMMLIKDGEALAAGPAGKIKAFLYFLTGVIGQIFLSLKERSSLWELFQDLLVYSAAASALLALISLISYLIKFAKLKSKPNGTGA